MVRFPRQWLAALSFAVVAGCGGAGSWWVVAHMQQEAALTASSQAQAFAASVARTLAGQFENAVTHGAPLEQIPRTEAYLQKIQRSTPGVSQITLRDAEGRTLAATPVLSAEQMAQALATVAVAGRTAGVVEVQVATTQFAQQGWQHVAWLPVVVVLVAALTAALVAGGLGRSAHRAHALLHARLPPAMALKPLGSDEFAPHPDDDPWQAALHRLLQGDADIQDRLAEVESLAQEMLAVDFDGKLAPRIEAIRAHALRALDQGPV